MEFGFPSCCCTRDEKVPSIFPHPQDIFTWYDNCYNTSVITTAGQLVPNKPEVIHKAFSSLGAALGCFSVSPSPYSGHILMSDFGWNCAGVLMPGRVLQCHLRYHTSWLILCLQRLSKAKFSSFNRDVFLSPFRMELTSKTLEYNPTEYKPKIIIKCPSNPLAEKSSVPHSLSWIFFFLYLIRSTFFKGLLQVTFCLCFLFTASKFKPANSKLSPEASAVIYEAEEKTPSVTEWSLCLTCLLRFFLSALLSCLSTAV